MYWTTETINAELDYRRQRAKDDMRHSRKHRPATHEGTSQSGDDDEKTAAVPAQRPHGRRRSTTRARQHVNA